MKALSPMLSRLSALGVLAAVLGGLWFGVAAPVRGAFAALEQERERLIGLKSRYRRAAAEIDDLQAGRDRMAARRKSRSELIEAPSAAAAAAEMQSDLKRAVESAGGELRRVQVAPAEKGEVAERIQLRGLATISLPGLSELLLSLEIEDPRYRIGDLRIEPDRSRRGKERRDLMVRFDLYGFRSRPASGARPGEDAPQAAPALRRLGDG